MSQNTTNCKFKDEILEIDVRVEDLLSNLTINEKFKLLSGNKLWWTNPIKRLGVPKMGMSDGPRGISFHSSYRRNTQFPVPKSMAASWDRELTELFGKAVAEEVRARKKHIVLAPGINIDRTPLNGRTFEYFSEDPYLIRELIVPMVNGMQGENIGACIKHYIANNQETNRHFVNAVIDNRAFREIYMRAYEGIVEESNPWSFMACYNRVNGQFGCESKVLLWDYLVEKFSFKGFVMSDWFATRNLTNPENSINAGLALEMPKPIIYSMKKLRKSFAVGKFSESRLDEVLKPMLWVMIKTGVLDKNLPKGSVNTKEHQKIARKIAEGSMTLLKNEKNILPLNKSEVKKIFITGCNANKKFGKFLYGGSSAVVPPYEVTPKTGLKNKIGSTVMFVKDASDADFALVFTGLNHDLNSDAESADRLILELSAEEEAIINNTAEKNPNTIVVLINGSPIAMSNWIDKVPAILEAWYPGMHGGDVIADTLFGDINPSGKLPITFPKKLSDSPAHQSNRTYPGEGKIIKENMVMSVFEKKPDASVWKDNNVFYDEGIYVGYRYFDKKEIEPLFPFGFGLSYTTFEYSDVSLDKNEISSEKDEIFGIELNIKNTGNRAGAEIVQIYFNEPESIIDRPPKELIGFKKVFLEPGEQKKVKINIKVKDLAYFGVDSDDWKINKGTIKLLVGASSRDIRSEMELKID